MALTAPLPPLSTPNFLKSPVGDAPPSPKEGVEEGPPEVARRPFIFLFSETGRTSASCWRLVPSGGWAVVCSGRPLRALCVLEGGLLGGRGSWVGKTQVPEGLRDQRLVRIHHCPPLSAEAQKVGLGGGPGQGRVQGGVGSWSYLHSVLRIPRCSLGFLLVGLPPCRTLMLEWQGPASWALSPGSHSPTQVTPRVGMRTRDCCRQPVLSTPRSQ